MRSTCGFAAGGEDEPATLGKLGKRVSAMRFAYLGCRTARVRSRSVQDLGPSDSDFSQLGWRRGSHSGFREGDSRRSDRRPDRAKPQVTRMIGVFDPHSRFVTKRLPRVRRPTARPTGPADEFRVVLQPNQTSSEKPRSTSAAEWPPRTPQLSSAGSRITTQTSVGSMAISPSLWTRVR